MTDPIAAPFLSHGTELPPVPGGSVDGLLTRAAERFGDRPAVIVPGAGQVTFAELDRQADAYARGLAGLLGSDGAPVLLSMALVPEFPALYYGIIRSGNVVNPANHMYSAEMLEHALSLSRARAAVVTPEVYQRLAPLRERLPDLEHVLLIGPAQDGVPSVLDLLADAPAGPAPVPSQGEATACVLFTSGSTRKPKPVQLSHRNLLTGAVQLSTAHEQDAGSVVLNGLPLYHPMHMNASTHVGATHVLSGGDVVDSVGHANEYRATHFYTLPFRLIQLSGHPRLGELELATVRMVASGGFPLRPTVLRALDRQFGVPMLQGYGMCETSSLAASDLLSAPRPGSVGRPLPGSRLRIVDLESRLPVAPHAIGEIQVQGPNVMKGYLVPQPEEAVDAEGWLSTGDVGYLDEEGSLFFLDRVRDVFTTGGVLVAPGQIECFLAEEPEVAECAAVDAPEGGGLVPVAFVVIRPAHRPDGPQALAALLEGVRERVNAQLEPHQRLHRVEALDELPRLANTKVDRTALRKRVR
ncbi:class I adenylate-forming enzyme family protein [Kitasatospora sp. NPDC002551]|uniref:class I adenylate-forming enzyme family protein n=1 Tax=Kitasatospora sp. NPDC002551 TaxID=3154539 RepID=UPI0033273032